MSIKAVMNKFKADVKKSVDKYFQATTACEKHQALRELKAGVKAASKAVKTEGAAKIAKIKTHGVHITVTFGKPKGKK